MDYKKYLLLTCLFLGTLVANGATPLNNSYKITKVPNVPQNDVDCIYQDSRGFIWIGTLDGLHRYDGYDYKTYRTSDSKNSINSNLIIDITEDSKGNIWIATYDKGICKLNPMTDEFTDYSYEIRYDDLTPIYDVSMMYIDKNDVMWLSHQDNLVRVYLDDAMEKVTQTTILMKLKTSAKDIFFDSQGQLWVGAHALMRIPNPYTDPKFLSVETFPGNVQSICESENEIIGLGDGLYILTKTSSPEIGKQYDVKRYGVASGGEVLYQGGRIWTANRRGVQCFIKDEKGTWVRDHSFNGDFGSLGLGSNVVSSMLYDPVSGIWVGTRGNGVNRIDLNPQRFFSYSKNSHPKSLSNNLVRCVFQDSYKQVWIGTEEGGVDIARDSKTTSFSKGFEKRSVNSNLSADRVYCVEEMPTPASKERESIIWLGTSYPTGMVGLDPHTLEVVRNSPEFRNVGFAFTMEVYDSMLWVGTYRQGLWRFIMDDEGNIISSKQFLPGDNANSINSDIIRYLLRDSKDNLWVGTDKGLMRILPDQVTQENPAFEDYSEQASSKRFGFDYILQIYEDTEGKIWVGTMGSGLLSYNQEVPGREVGFVNITTEDGLPNNTIKSIVEDDEGNLWLATNKGLSRYNPVNHKITNYDEADGLQSNEFSEICGIKLSDGRIIMGGIQGFDVFDPREIYSNQTPPKPYFTEFYVQNELIRPQQEVHGRVLLDKSISFTKKVALKYSENSFSIGFVGIHHKSPQKNDYKYMLEGFDKEWITTSSRFRIANYTNIPAGRYTFRVNCSNCDNKWCEKPIELAIRIYPPFYASWVAILIYFLLIAFSIYFILRYRQNKEEERQKLLIAEIEKKQVEEISLMRQQFFTNVSHEFKTPLTLIKGPIDRLLKNPEMQEKNKLDSYKLIKQNVRIMMRLISQLMDFRKLDQDKMVLKYSKVEVNAFVKSIFNSFESWAVQKDLNFSFVGLEHTLETTFDTEKMEVVVYNIVSNAIKNTPNKGNVQIKIQEVEDEGEFAIIVSDTGIGIPVKDQPHIFERFFQSYEAKKRNTGGTGIGLAHSKGLIEKMNGDITFESEEGVGATFFIHMPLKNEDAVDESELVLHIEEDIDLDKEKSTHQEEALPVQILPDRNTILVVDDNYDLRHFIAGEFTEDYNIVLAEDGVEGLAMAEKYNPDIIISDVMMPNMDGVEMCRRIKTQEQTSHIPVVMLTSKTSDEAQKKGFSTGADAYVAKPFSADVLKLRIKSILKNRETIKDQFQKEIKINPMVISNTDADVKFMEKILQLIEDNLSDPEFNVEKLAKAYGVSRVYLSKKIKALTGESTIQFQRTVRLKHAAELLVQKGLTVSEVAWEVGYNDLNTFRQRFKEKFEMSPSEYRNSNSPKKER